MFSCSPRTGGWSKHLTKAAHCTPKATLRGHFSSLFARRGNGGSRDRARHRTGFPVRTVCVRGQMQLKYPQDHSSLFLNRYHAQEGQVGLRMREGGHCVGARCWERQKDVLLGLITGPSQEGCCPASSARDRQLRDRLADISVPGWLGGAFHSEGWWGGKMTNPHVQ